MYKRQHYIHNKQDYIRFIYGKTYLFTDLFRHKTRRWYFVVGIPAITLAEYGLLAWALLVR